jgi:glycosyltransferase involved in cell wall biosynthesis/ubiquinone/menaquinone biosynthesis C-methylase UbiE
MKPLRYKILFLASWYPSRVNKVLGIFVKRKAEAMTKHCDVALIYVVDDTSLKDKNYDIESSIENSVFTVRIYFKKSPNQLANLILYNFRYLKSYYLGWREVKSNWGKPDLIHSNVIDRSGYIAIFFKLLKGIDYVITEHSTPDIDFLRGITNKTKIPLRFLKKIVIKKCSYLNVDSYSSLEFLRKVGFEGNLGVIPNIVELDEKFLYLKQPTKPKENKSAVHISILNNRKNVADIIRAYAYIQNDLNRRDCSFNIIGEGSEKNNLVNLAEELGVLNKCVFFHGLVPEEKKLELLTNSDFHILNSNDEGFSVVTAEAILYGVPVIATKCGGPEDFVSETTGLLIERKNLDELKKAILYMLDNSWRYDKTKLHEFGKSMFTPDVISAKTYDVYHNAIINWRAGNTSKVVKINPEWKVLDVGSGHQPNRRANVIIDKYMGKTIHRTTQQLEVSGDKYFILGDALSTPLTDKKFDFVIASHIAEHIDDPIKFCNELQRISKRGYIETPGPLTELLLPANSHKWIVRKSGNGLIFKKNNRTKPLVSLFYSIFYLNRDGYDFRTKNSTDIILKFISWILTTSWKYIPYTYARLVWEDKFECKIK